MLSKEKNRDKIKPTVLHTSYFFSDGLEIMTFYGIMLTICQSKCKLIERAYDGENDVNRSNGRNIRDKRSPAVLIFLILSLLYDRKCSFLTDILLRILDI